MTMTKDQVFDWCKAHAAARVLYSTCDALDDPFGDGGYFIHRITYANGDTYEHTERGPMNNTLFETRINGELVLSYRRES